MGIDLRLKAVEQGPRSSLFELSRGRFKDIVIGTLRIDSEAGEIRAGPHESLLGRDLDLKSVGYKVTFQYKWHMKEFGAVVLYAPYNDAIVIPMEKDACRGRRDVLVPSVVNAGTTKALYLSEETRNEYRLQDVTISLAQGSISVGYEMKGFPKAWTKPLAVSCRY